LNEIIFGISSFRISQKLSVCIQANADPTLKSISYFTLYA